MDEQFSNNLAIGESTNEKKTSILTIINNEDQADKDNEKYLNVSNSNLNSNININKTSRINLLDKAPSLSFDITFNEPNQNDESPPSNIQANPNITSQVYLNVTASPSKSITPVSPLLHSPSPSINNATINLNWPVVQNKIDDLNEFVKFLYFSYFKFIIYIFISFKENN